jgi:pyridoxine 5-phosphate synthase
LNGDDFTKYINQFKTAKEFLARKSIACHAGHGLTDESVKPLLEEKIFEEYNIGHWIICEAIFKGLGNTVKNLKNIFEAMPLK